MRLDLDRHTNDPSIPTARQVRHDLAVRVGVPAVVLWLAVVGLGLLVTGPLAALGERELTVNEWFVAHRTELLDSLTHIWSPIGTTETVIGICLVVVGAVWWRTRQWWYAVVPAIAVATQAAVFLVAALVVGRERPDVAQLDVAPPTSSFPSGHSGAATALYVTLAMMAQRVERTWVRVSVTVILLVLPMLVVYSRLYRGMHHVSDVIVGVLNGLVCAVLAWNYLRTSPRPARDATAVRAVERAR
ncbi:phosphatase PAP2 family protein [Cellulomonas chengniuliangii]|uniref:Phosphatase PAP2 family protein n=1 Tax=Cellulomonas chengniuliangii TaxID=2968084 RepID=A0ABY5KXG5_9CELL|nr:phosphatase PAP2 family protein [Cellulomonas chengniuliangii]MCC2309322.1 phosphatase PAP2 family protein [Cellulomonas chengniuliangii]MCC2316592.1 phosphatase PAP2 family protein [Cellulomonas chengniuliangii]UUI75109.1 phosphatase PAP2 family protein [Cellulomonas chengniuliangii]